MPLAQSVMPPFFRRVSNAYRRAFLAQSFGDSDCRLIFSVLAGCFERSDPNSYTSYRRDYA